MPRGSHRTFRAEHAAERRGDLVLRELRIAPGTQKAGLCDEQRALAVAVDGTALHHERCGIIAAKAERIQQAARKGIVLLPVGVQAVDLAAPGIEAPVDAAHRAVGGSTNKCRATSRAQASSLSRSSRRTLAIPASIRSAEGRECGFTAT